MADTLDRARDGAENGWPADSPDERSVPHYLQSIALSLTDIAESLRHLRRSSSTPVLEGTDG